MAIGKNKSEVDKRWESLDPQPRKYSNAELRDFHQMIQKFNEPKKLTTGEVVQHLNWDKMSVAFGAYTVTEYLGMPLYRAVADRDWKTLKAAALSNLWNQYRDYLQRVDWATQEENKRLDELSTVVALQVSE